MKQKVNRHGGSRLGAGRPYKWHGGKTKLIRIPVAYVNKILRVVVYMDTNEGQLPQNIAFFTEPDSPLPGYKPHSQLKQQESRSLTVLR